MEFDGLWRFVCDGLSCPGKEQELQYADSSYQAELIRLFLI